VKRQLRDFNRRAGRPYQLSISLGFATHKANTLGSVAGLLDRADRALYRDKRASTTQTDRTPLMVVKRKPRRSDPQRSLRDHLVELLDGVTPCHLRGRDRRLAAGTPERQTRGQPFTPGVSRAYPHLAMDIVEFTKSAKHVSPEWPAGYWPASDAPPDAAAGTRASPR